MTNRKAFYLIFISVMLLIISGCGYFDPAEGIPGLNQEFKITGREIANCYYGVSVDIDGDYAIVGESGDPVTNPYTGGAVFFYHRTQFNYWVEMNDFIMEQGSSDKSFFGIAVAISGNYAVVGAKSEDITGTNAGAAYIYKMNNGVWDFVQKLTSDPIADNTYFGESVDIDGDYIIIGASGENAAYVFRRHSDNSWQISQRLNPGQTTADNFGYSVVINDDFAVIGSSSTENPAGEVYIIKRTSTDGWDNDNPNIIAGNSINATTPYEPLAVTINGNYIAVGIPGYDDAGAHPDSGGVFVFYCTDRTTNQWTAGPIIKAPIEENYGKFGFSVSIDGNNLLIGNKNQNNIDIVSAGAMYLFQNNGAGSWNYLEKYQASDGKLHDHFGSSVAVSGDFFISGTPDYDIDDDGSNGDNYGAAYIISMEPL